MGFASVADVPSPNVHAYEPGLPVLSSVNETVSGTLPDTLSVLNAAPGGVTTGGVGVPFSVTVMNPCLASKVTPSALIALRVTE